MEATGPTPIDFNAVAEQLEAAELAAGTLPHDDYVKLLAVYLLNDELSASKLLWRRIPDRMKCTPDMQRIYRIGQVLWVKLHVDAMRMTDFGWSEGLKPFIGALRDSIRRQALDVIRQNYTVVSIDLFQMSLGIDRERAVRIAQHLGWVNDRQFIYPVLSARQAMPPEATEVLESLSNMQLD